MNKVKRDNWIAVALFGVCAVSFYFIIHYHDLCLVENITVCGRAERVVDMTRFHKSKKYEDYVIVVKWDNGKREDVSVTRMSFLSVKEGGRVCFDRSIISVYVDETHPFERNAYIAIFAAVFSILFCIYFGTRNIPSVD